MKRFKIGFLAIVGLIAMSFSVADNLNAFDPQNIPNCYIPQIDYKLSCSSPLETLESTTSCEEALLADEKPVFDESGFTNPVACDDEGDIFCCANLRTEATARCTPNQGQLFQEVTTRQGTKTTGWVVIDEIHCKFED